MQDISFYLYIFLHQAHAHFYIMDAFTKMVGEVDDQPIRDVLTQLCKFFACYGIHNNAAVFLEVNLSYLENICVLQL